jgi:hypothetical protein
MGKSGGLAEAPASEVRAKLVSTCRLTGAIPQARERAEPRRASERQQHASDASNPKRQQHTHDTTSGTSITCDTRQAGRRAKERKQHASSASNAKRTRGLPTKPMRHQTSERVACERAQATGPRLKEHGAPTTRVTPESGAGNTCGTSAAKRTAPLASELRVMEARQARMQDAQPDPGYRRRPMEQNAHAQHMRPLCADDGEPGASPTGPNRALRQIRSH